MGLWKRSHAVLITLLILGHPTTGSDNFLVKSTPDVSVRRGHTVTLPCWLDPPQSAEALEVQWTFMNKGDSLVMQYKDKKLSSPEYGGRVSFGFKDSRSGGLASGDVSLQLTNVMLKDLGRYRCYVSSDQSHGNEMVSLVVRETGSPLHLSVAWAHNNTMNVSCSSEGWYPKPHLRWSNQKDTMTPGGITYSEDFLGLLSVHSWILVSDSSEIICTVGLRGDEEKESRLLLGKPVVPVGESDSSSAGLVALALLLVFMTIIAIILGIAFYKNRGKNNKLPMEVEVEEEKDRLLSEDMPLTDLSTARSHYENIIVTIPENRQAVLLMKVQGDGHIVRDKKNIKIEKVSCLTAFTGTSSFSSGQHYWEVSLGNNTIGLKQSWWLGVTRVADIPYDEAFSPTESNGYWFLSSSPEKPEFFQLSTDPASFVPVTSRPQRVGVYLDCERGKVTFYDVESSSVIARLTVDFRGELFPFFNPGLFDTAALKILHNETETVQVNNEETVISLPENNN